VTGAGPPAAARLRGLLEARLGEWPGEIEHFQSLASTSDRLRSRPRAPQWSVVVADEQTAGRGRHGRSWASPRGGLYLSVLLRPSLAAGRAALLPLAVAVACCDALEELGLHAQIKWPNDLVVGDRKLGGILVEASSDGGRLDSAIVGIGVNLDLAEDALPAGLAGASTSFRAETGRTVSPLETAAVVLARLTVWYAALARDERGRMLSAWRERAASWWGSAVEVRCGESVLCGVARDVDHRGALLLDLPDGTSVALLSGEARELRLAPSGPRRVEPAR
jgi:BirA family biotin operon repressor/biotin-[acetyl-CoA-carboxylase] ligase